MAEPRRRQHLGDDAGTRRRTVLPLPGSDHLDGGYTLHFGGWVAIHPDDLQRAFAIWWTPEYEQLELDGHLANDLPGWGGLAAPVHVVVRNTDHTPYVVASSDDSLEDVLRRTWPHDDALSRLPD